MIPPIIHHIWIQGPPPETFKEKVDQRKLLNPDWTVRVWSGVELRELIRRHFSEALLDLYDHPERLRNVNASHYVQSNIGRVVVVYLFGGWYMDIDAYCSMPMSELNIPKSSKLALTREHTAFGAARRHPGMLAILRKNEEAVTRGDIPVAFGEVLQHHPHHQVPYYRFSPKALFPNTPFTVCGIPYDTSWNQPGIIQRHHIVGVISLIILTTVIVGRACNEK